MKKVEVNNYGRKNERIRDVRLNISIFYDIIKMVINKWQSLM